MSTANQTIVTNGRIRPGAKALIIHDEKILIVKERLYTGKIITDFPGGGVEYGESLETALHREVLEEVGLKIQIDKMVGNWNFMVPNWNNPESATIHILCIGFQCECVGEPVIDLTQNPAEEDIFECLWLTKEELLDQGNELFSRADCKEDILQAVGNIEIE